MLGGRKRPTTTSSSSCARICISGCAIVASTHQSKVIVIVAVPAELQNQFKICVSNDSKRTHYNNPRTQAISSRESPLRSEFLISATPMLGLSEPLAWSNSFSGNICRENAAYCAHNVITNSIQTPIKQCCMLAEVFQSFAFPSCKSRVLLR